MSWLLQDFTISFGIWVGIYATMGDCSRLKAHGILDLTAEEYITLMNDNVEDLTELGLWSLEKIRDNKAKVARAYNKKVRPKENQAGDLVWEPVLPLGTKDAAYDKWSPNWHGPYRVEQVLPGNAYMLEELNGDKF